MKTLEQAREERLDREIDKMIADKIKANGVSLESVGPAARVKLRGILKKYAKSAHPFRECVRDNMSRFGPGRTEAICASLKDTIRGTTKWRKGGAHTSEDDGLTIDADVLLALDAVTEIDLQEILLEARAMEEHGTTEAVPLLEVTGRSEIQRWGIGHEQLARMEAQDV